MFTSFPLLQAQHGQKQSQGNQRQACQELDLMKSAGRRDKRQNYADRQETALCSIQRMRINSLVPSTFSTASRAAPYGLTRQLSNGT